MPSADTLCDQLRRTGRSLVRAYVAVPVRLSDGQLYGALCCVSDRPHPELAERDVAFVEVLATIVAEQLKLDETALARRALWQDAVRDVIVSDAIRPVFQPIVDIYRGTLVGPRRSAASPMA